MKSGSQSLDLLHRNGSCQIKDRECKRESVPLCMEHRSGVSMSQSHAIQQPVLCAHSCKEWVCPVGRNPLQSFQFSRMSTRCKRRACLGFWVEAEESLVGRRHECLFLVFDGLREADGENGSFIEAISNKQGELENYVSDGYKTALTEERRRFCFLVEKQCAVAKNALSYHSKGKDILTQKLPLWQQSCSDPNKIPDRAIQLMQQMAIGSNGTVMPSPLSTSKSNLIISDPIPGAKPLPVPPELAPFVGRMSAQETIPVMNGVSSSEGEDYNHWSDRKPPQPKSLSPPQTQKQLSDSYSNTLPVRKSVMPKNSYATTENKTLPRSSSMAAGLEKNGRTRVRAIFSHAAGDNSTLLSFKEGDLITLLVPEARDGWHYGESEKTKLRGWFPFSYTRVLDTDASDRLHMSQGKSSSTGNLLDKDDIPPPDYSMSSRAFQSQNVSTFKQRPYSVAMPPFTQFSQRQLLPCIDSGGRTNRVNLTVQVIKFWWLQGYVFFWWHKPRCVLKETWNLYCL
ncbi:Brain-specific angiogenesis inhibitor 1-associated protein 2 [Varanus komodoensis]|nr:Brain-specific angiogenesis inhibitor 1-associated protein 2 [Varanus komodoensis]